MGGGERFRVVCCVVLVVVAVAVAVALTVVIPNQTAPTSPDPLLSCLSFFFYSQALYICLEGRDGILQLPKGRLLEQSPELRHPRHYCDPFPPDYRLPRHYWIRPLPYHPWLTGPFIR